MTKQVYNPEMAQLMRVDFPTRNEPNYAWGNAVSALSLLPGLRGFWPMSAINAGPTVPDLSANALTLTVNGTPTANNVGLAPIMEFVGGSTEYLSRADGTDVDILGTETFIGNPGLTLGCWARWDALGAEEGLISKWRTIGANRSYRLYKTAGNSATCEISVDGTAVTSVADTVSAAGEWYFVAGRFTPSTELAIFLNGTLTTNVAAIPASIFNSTTTFEIGRTNAGSYLTGDISLAFLVASALPDVILNSIYWQTKSLFGVQ